MQAAFTKNRVQRHVDVPKLIRAKYQDNLEFCQWLKAFFEHAAPPERENYDPVAARNRGKGGKVAKRHFESTAKQHTSKLLPTDRPRPKETSVGESRQGLSGSSRSRPTAISNMKENKNVNGGAKRVATGRTAPVTSTKPITSNSTSTRCAKGSSDVTRGNEQALKQKNEELERKVAELELTLTSMEKERDFYFGKLRDIEILVQSHEENDTSDAVKLIKKVFKVLYATSDDNVVVDDDGNILGYNDESEILDDIMDGEPQTSFIENDAIDDQIIMEKSIEDIGLSDNEDDDLLVY